MEGVTQQCTALRVEAHTGWRLAFFRLACDLLGSSNPPYLFGRRLVSTLVLVYDVGQRNNHLKGHYGL